MHYSEAFKRRMVQKLSGPGAISAYALAKEEGVSQTTLSRWKRQAGTLSGMTTRKKKKEAQKNTTRKRPQDWSLDEKLQAVVEASGLSDEELGAFLRRKGLHEATLNQWRDLVASALGRPQPKNKKSRELKEAEKRVRKLEREVKRKNAALAETAALMVLKKKARAIWGDEDDDTDPKSGS
jgi:transposase-like protein